MPIRPFLADRAIGRPLLLHPAKAELVWSVLADRIGLDSPAPLSPEANRLLGEGRPTEWSGRPQRHGGVAVITVEGSLVNRGAWVGADSGLTSYEGIGALIADAEADPAVHSIVLDLDCYGGEVPGLPALAERISACAKPTVAVANDHAFSAAYWLAAAAGRIVVSPTGGVGSIGVVMLHVDRSAQAEAQGVKPTYIFAGSHKVDGHPFEPLRDEVRADWQAEIDSTYQMFTDAIGRLRGAALSADAARGTEARMFFGEAALAAGLADEIGTLDQVIARLNEGAASAPNPSRRKTMADETISVADAEARAQTARAEGAAAERERMSAILSGEHVEGREAAAIELALDAECTPTLAGKMLGKMPKAGAAAPAPLAQREEGREEMGAGGKPEGSADLAASVRETVRAGNRRPGRR